MKPNLKKLFATAVPLALLLAACASGEASDSQSESTEPAAITTVRLGYFPNLTHAPALVGIQQGLFKNALKDLEITVTPTIFNAGPDAVSALFGGSLDCTYIGPNPAVNAYAQSAGSAVEIVSGAASGGAALVVRDGIETIDDLRGKSIATPQLGNTQDVALRAWLNENGIETTVEGGGDVSIRPQSNAEGLAAFALGELDGAWVPQPWVAEYVAAGAKVFLNEKELWEDGKFVTTVLACRTEFIRDYPEVVRALINGHLDSLDSIAADKPAAIASMSLALTALTGTAPKDEILNSALNDVEFTYDPISSSLVKSAEDAISVGLLDADLIDAAGGLPGGIFNLTILNEVLAERGLEAVK